jgi:hypothetical protein
LEVVDFTKHLKSIGEENDEVCIAMRDMCKVLAVYFYDLLGFQKGGRVWDPNTMGPYNDITKVYVAAVQHHKEKYYCSTDFTASMSPIKAPTIQDEDLNFRIDGNTLSKLECTFIVNEKKKKREKPGKKKQSAPKKKKIPKIMNMIPKKNNPFEGQKICFDVGAPFGNKLLHHFQVDKFLGESIQVLEGKSYLFGVIHDSVGKEKNVYQINWNCTCLKGMNVSWAYILSAIVLANDIEKMKCAKDRSDAIENFFQKTDSSNNGEPLNSDCKADNETVSNLMGESSRV